jgi:hypothetical protein
MPMAVPALSDPLRCLLGDFFTSEFLGSVANLLGSLFPIWSMPCRLAGKGVSNFVQDNLL